MSDRQVKRRLRAKDRKAAIAKVVGEPEGGGFTDRNQETTRELSSYDSFTDELRTNDESIKSIKEQLGDGSKLPPEQQAQLRSRLEDLQAERKALLKGVENHHLINYGMSGGKAGGEVPQHLVPSEGHEAAHTVVTGDPKGPIKGRRDFAADLPESGFQNPDAVGLPAVNDSIKIDPRSEPGGRAPAQKGVLGEAQDRIAYHNTEIEEASALAKESRAAEAKANSRALAADKEAAAATDKKSAQKASARADQLREQAAEHAQDAAVQEALIRDRQIKIKKFEDALPKTDTMLRGSSKADQALLGRPA